jgi:hypothetical protein
VKSFFNALINGFLNLGGQKVLNLILGYEQRFNSIDKALANLKKIVETIQTDVKTVKDQNSDIKSVLSGQTTDIKELRKTLTDGLQEVLSKLSEGPGPKLDQAIDLIQQILDLLTYEPEAVEIRFNVLFEGTLLEGVNSMVITATQKFTASIDPRDAKGNPTVLDGAPTWASSAPEVITVTPAEDGMSAEIVAAGPVGTGQISVTADARLGEEVVPVAAVLDVEVKPGEAVTLVVNTTAPVEQ